MEGVGLSRLNIIEDFTLGGGGGLKESLKPSTRLARFRAEIWG